MLYANYWTKVYAQAFKRLQNTEQAKDVTQEVFVSLWARKELNRIDNLAAYLFTAVRNNVFKLQRKQELFTPVNDLMEELYASPNKISDYKNLKKMLNGQGLDLVEEEREIEVFVVSKVSE